MIPVAGPLTLKSISPVKSSNHCISVRTAYFLPSSNCFTAEVSPPSFPITNPIAIPLTGFFIGTQASIRERQAAHTAPIEVEPLQLIISDTTLIVYGNSSLLGNIGSIVFSANLPCPISLLDCHLYILASLVE